MLAHLVGLLQGFESFGEAPCALAPADGHQEQKHREPDGAPLGSRQSPPTPLMVYRAQQMFRTDEEASAYIRGEAQDKKTE